MKILSNLNERMGDIEKDVRNAKSKPFKDFKTFEFPIFQFKKLNYPLAAS